MHSPGIRFNKIRTSRTWKVCSCSSSMENKPPPSWSLLSTTNIMASASCQARTFLQSCKPRICAANSSKYVDQLARRLSCRQLFEQLYAKTTELAPRQDDGECDRLLPTKIPNLKSQVFVLDFFYLGWQVSPREASRMSRNRVAHVASNSWLRQNNLDPRSSCKNP